MSASTSLGRLYLIAGDDAGTLATAIERLRARAESESGPGSLERVPVRADGGLDVDELAGSASLLSLTAEHRYLLAEGAERLNAATTKQLGGVLGALAEEITVVLVCREQPKPGLVKVVEAAEGDVHTYEAPKARELPAWLAQEAKRRGLDLAPTGARALIERIGPRTERLGTELDRLALWAEPGERIERETVAASVADDSEEAVWTLSDAIVERRPEVACRALERMLEGGRPATPIIYGVAKSLREAVEVAARLEAGEPAGSVAGTLPMPDWRAKKLIGRVRGAAADELRGALGAFAEAEWQTRGGADRDDAAALVIAVRQAAGAGPARA